MKLPRFSDIPLVFKIGCPPAFALLMLASVGTSMLWAQHNQTIVLGGVIKGDSFQNQLATNSESITAANGELYVLMTKQAAGGSPADSQKALKKVLRKIDDVRTNLVALSPYLSNDQRNGLADVLKELTVYRGGIVVLGLMLEVDFNSASSFIQPFEAIYTRMTTTLNNTSQSLAATSAERAKDSANVVNVIGKVMVAIIAGTLLAVAAVASAIVVAVRNAIKDICEATESLAAGRDDLNLECLERGDELGGIVRSLTIFRENQYRIIAMRAEKEAMEAQRETTRIEQEHITCMISALSETNEAILRAETRDKLFQLVCKAAVLGGKFSGAGIALPTPNSNSLRFIAADGLVGDFLQDLDVPIYFAPPKSQLITTVAFQTGQPCVSNDYPALAFLGNAYRHAVQEIGTFSAAALPLISHGQAIGVFLFLSAERNTFTPAFIEILQRLSRNVSFALENLERAAEKEQADERIRHLATHDSLTDLPNRMLFNQLLEYSIKTASRYERRCAVLFIDLDRFKLINDSLGHAAGDTLLIDVANRLRGAVRNSDVVARLGGDEFVVLLNEITEIQQVATVAGNLLTALSNPLELNGQECHVTASIGIAIYPDDGADEHTLTKHADMAMYLAKSEGKNDIRFFSNEIKTQCIGRLAIETDLRNAIDRNEFCLHYQPKLDVCTKRISGVEALLRWNHPKLGLLSPIQFIPVAEETGLIVPIGRWVMQTACAQAVAWQRQGFPPISMAVNVSPRQFSDENLLRDIEDALAVSSMDPTSLQIEITESMVMLNVERAIRVLDSIQSRGVRLAVDDFGTGYSSMSLLKRFPIDTIKIDRTFVRDLPQNLEDRAITQAIISMGKALGLKIIAEGVETFEQDQFLCDHGCDEIQGFLFSKPVPAEKISEMLGLTARRMLIPAEI